jgi:hypothetical protein
MFTQWWGGAPTLTLTVTLSKGDEMKSETIFLYTVIGVLLLYSAWMGNQNNELRGKLELRSTTDWGMKWENECLQYRNQTLLMRLGYKEADFWIGERNRKPQQRRR